MMGSDFYPYKCEFILKEKLWGGNQLRDFLKKTTSSEKYGESWEVASLPEGKSSIANGKHKSKSLDQMISAFAEALLGESVVANFGLEMPLLIKFIDASEKLSIQLHPDDAIAQELHNLPKGKTEMWYVLKAEKGAHIIAGFNQEMDSQKFKETLSNGNLEGALQHIPVKEGDAFYIKAGLIHAIGKGIVLAEIQQTSDVTYRIYDYNRKQADGNLRELHIENACRAIKFTEVENVALPYSREQKGLQVLKHNSYFKTDIVNLEEGLEHTVARNNSFTILIAVKGEGVIECDNEKYNIKQGDTYLIPAHCSGIVVRSRMLKFLEVYM